MAEVRLIDGNKAEAVLRNIADHLKEAENTDLWPATYAAADVIKHQPTIDPESLGAKGRWIYKWDAERDPKKLFVRIVCSECNLHTGQKSNYCPNCGAKMNAAE